MQIYFNYKLRDIVHTHIHADKVKSIYITKTTWGTTSIMLDKQFKKGYNQISPSPQKGLLHNYQGI